MGAARRLEALGRHLAIPTRAAEAAMRQVAECPVLAAATGQVAEGGGRAFGDAGKVLLASRRQGHTVPSNLRETGGSAVVFYENNARRLSHAEKARTLLRASRSGMLSTLHHETGWPYGSVVNFVSENGRAADGSNGPRLLTFVSKMAEHSANLATDQRASLLVANVQGNEDHLATTRATFLLEAVQVEKTASAKEAFLGVHPHAHYIHFDDFLCFELQVRRIRYIGGFGEMSWVEGDDFAGAEADPVAGDAEAADRAIKHCNEDHADAVLAMARALSGLAGAEKATMLAVDRYGFDVLCTMPDGLRRSRVEFSSRLEQGDTLHKAILEASQRARAILAKDD